MAQRDFGPTSDLGPIGQSVHTETYNPAPNNNQGDMGITHSYRFVNTEGMYLSYGDLKKEIQLDLGSVLTDYYMDSFTLPTSSISGDRFYNNILFNCYNTPHARSYDSDVSIASGEKFQIKSRDYFKKTFNIVSAAAEHTLEYPAYDYPNQIIDLTAQHSYRNINTIGLYRYRPGTTMFSFNQIIDIGSYAASGVSYHEEAIHSPILGGLVYDFRWVNITNIPVMTHTLEKKLDSGIYGNNPSIDLTASHSIRFLNTQGTLYKRFSDFAGSVTIDVGYATQGVLTSYDSSNVGIILDSNYFWDNVQAHLYNIPTIDGIRVPDLINNYQAFPLCEVRQRATSTAFNNMVTVPNRMDYANISFIAFPGTRFAKGAEQTSYYVDKSTYVNDIFNFRNDSSCGLTESNYMLGFVTINSTSGLAVLNIQYNGWYKIELSAFCANTKVMAPVTQTAVIYKFASSSDVPANGNFEYSASSTTTCARLLYVYMNNSGAINNQPVAPSLPYSYFGYGFAYTHLYKGNCLAGRINSGTDTTRVSVFRLGLVYNSALKILR